VRLQPTVRQPQQPDACQKKNPDVRSLVRANGAGCSAILQGLRTMIKGLPPAYNKDCSRKTRKPSSNVSAPPEDCSKRWRFESEEGHQLPPRAAVSNACRPISPCHLMCRLSRPPGGAVREGPYQLVAVW